MKKFLTYITALAGIVGSSAHGDAVIFSGSDVKTLKPNIQLFNQAKIMSGTVDPSAVATSAAVGSIYLNTSNGNTYKKLDAGLTTNWSVLGTSGSSGINYIVNSDLEASVTGYVAYADAAGTSPVDGTGGSPTVTATRTTSGGDLIRGKGTLKITKDAANRQGQGVSIDFKVDPHDYKRGAALPISFEYKTSADYATDDVQVFVYDKDGAALLGVYAGDSLNAGKLSASTLGTKFTGYFYPTVATSDDYRLIFHIRTTSALAYDVFADTVRVGPDQVIPGQIGSPWEALSLVPNASGFGTITNSKIMGKRVGDTLMVTGSFKAGTVGAALAEFVLPAGYVIDSTKLNAVAQTQAVGIANLVVAAGPTQHFSTNNGLLVFFDGSATDRVFLGPTSQSNAIEKYLVNAFMTSNDNITFEFKIPIANWAESVAQSTTETLFSAVKARYKSDAAQAFASASTDVVDFEDKVYDTHSSVTVGASWKFTSPKTAKYKLCAKVALASSSGWDPGEALQIDAFKNGTRFAVLNLSVAESTTTLSRSATGCSTTEIPKGEYIDVRLTQDTGGSVAMLNNGDHVYIDIEEQPDFSVFSNYNTVDRQYACTSSGPGGWTQGKCIAIPYITADGAWRVKLNVAGTLTAASSAAVAISGLTFKNDSQYQSCSVGDNGGAQLAFYSRANPNASTVTSAFNGNVSDISFSCDVELNSKPTFVP